MTRLTLVKRPPLKRWQSALLPVWAILITLALSGLLIAFAGANPAVALAAIFSGAFGGRFNLLETLTSAVPLAFTGLAVAFAFRAKFWNIGAEGQLLAGASAVTALGLALPPTLSPAIAVPALVAAGFLAGGAYAAIPALLKTKFRVDDVVSTLLLNYLMYHVMGILLFGPLQMEGSSWPVSGTLPEGFSFPILVARSRLHAGFALAVAAALAMWFVQSKTRLGYRTVAVGSNERAATFGGINSSLVLVITAVISGGLAGLAGASEVLGVQHRLLMEISPGYGYTGVVIAMLSRLNPLGAFACALFFSAVGTGADTMSRVCRVPAYISEVVQGLSLLVMLVLLLFNEYTVKKGRAP
jgi:general nucleoside transport system permease protein